MLYQLSYRAGESTTRIRTENLQIKNVVPPAFAASPSGWRQQVDESFRLDYRNQAGSGLAAPPFHVLPPAFASTTTNSQTLACGDKSVEKRLIVVLPLDHRSSEAAARSRTGSHNVM
jgi:hypothetical protein